MAACFLQGKVQSSREIFRRKCPSFHILKWNLNAIHPLQKTTWKEISPNRGVDGSKRLQVVVLIQIDAGKLGIWCKSEKYLVHILQD